MHLDKHMYAGGSLSRLDRHVRGHNGGLPTDIGKLVYLLTQAEVDLACNLETEHGVFISKGKLREARV